jgi:hypothetical protein
MLPFKVHAVVTCDDIRLEQNNKAILIGVYNGTIVVGGFPTDLRLAWWIQIFAEHKEKHDLEVRILKDGNSTLLRAFIGIEVQTPGWATLMLPPAPLQLQSAGRLELEMRLKDAEKWDTLVVIDAKEGEPPGIHPAPSQPA